MTKSITSGDELFNLADTRSLPKTKPADKRNCRKIMRYSGWQTHSCAKNKGFENQFSCIQLERKLETSTWGLWILSYSISHTQERERETVFESAGCDQNPEGLCRESTVKRIGDVLNYSKLLTYVTHGCVGGPDFAVLCIGRWIKSVKIISRDHSWMLTWHYGRDPGSLQERPYHFPRWSGWFIDFKKAIISDWFSAWPACRR